MNKYLSYKNARLLPYTEEHYIKTIEWLNDPKIYESFGLTKRLTLESHRRWITSLKDASIWAIYDSDLDIHCGNILLFCNLVHHSAFFQVYLGESKSRGKNLGFASLTAVINHAFQSLNINRIWLQVFPDNIRAITLYEKLGFVLEGVERESHFNNLSFKDQLRYSLLKREWLAKEGEG